MASAELSLELGVCAVVLDDVDLSMAMALVEDLLVRVFELLLHV